MVKMCDIAFPAYNKKGRVHSGFWEALHNKRACRGISILEEIMNILNTLDASDDNDYHEKEIGIPRKHQRPVYVTGHSLGGALRYFICFSI
jgi:predicted alpha/beta-fold hydrolase